MRDRKTLVRKLINRDGTRCHYCGVELAFDNPNAENYRTIDHKFPKDRGGRENLGNLVLACHNCNIAKKNKSYKDFKDSQS
jgi:5-methylcytosine-specific restriction endonuclease McrA